jgi:hypothetical protein
MIEESAADAGVFAWWTLNELKQGSLFISAPAL